MADTDPDDIDEVMRQERSRGRKPLPSKLDIKAHRQRVKQWRDILRAMTWDEVVNALELQRDSNDYDEWYRTWRAYHRDHPGGGQRR